MEVGTAADKAIMTGDMIHSPLQAYDPDLGMFSDLIPRRRRARAASCSAAIVTRLRSFCTAHFPGSSIGRFISSADSFQFVPIETS